YEDSQIRDLMEFGFHTDREVVRQSARQAIYQSHFDTLVERRMVYPCFCSRKDLKENSAGDIGGNLVYTGKCSQEPWNQSMARVANGERHSWRLRVSAAPSTFFDGFRGFVDVDLRRTDG